jgi:hypothetical protein
MCCSAHSAQSSATAKNAEVSERIGQLTAKHQTELAQIQSYVPVNCVLGNPSFSCECVVVSCVFVCTERVRIWSCGTQS